VKLFQIEEPDGSPSDPDAPGVSIGIDATGPEGEVALDRKSTRLNSSHTS